MDEVLPDGPEAHPDPCTDATQISRPTRNRQPTQKTINNKKQSDIKKQAQRATTLSTSDKTLVSEALYYRYTTVNLEDPIYYNFNPIFNLNTTINKLVLIKAFQTIKEAIFLENKQKLLIYYKAINSLYTK